MFAKESMLQKQPKKKMKFLFPLLICVLLVSDPLLSQHQICKAQKTEAIVEYTENRGQWFGDFAFKGSVDGATVFLQADGFVFCARSNKDVNRMHDTQIEYRDTCTIHSHWWKQTFENCNSVKPKGELPGKQYYNYFCGGEGVTSYAGIHPVQRVVYENLWDGIDLIVTSQGSHFKYEFIVKPNADPSQIAWNYDGLDTMLLQKGDLVLSNSIGKYLDRVPIAYQLNNGRMSEIEIAYSLSNKKVSFSIGAFISADTLIIDPVLVASTFVGSTSTQNGVELWGYHAGYDQEGNILLASMPSEPVFSATTGAFLMNFSGGYVDIGISKFDPNGNELLWASYLGGSGNETPSTFVCSNLNEVYLCGTTTSPDFPIASNGFDTSIGGFMDIFIVKISEDGSVLMGSTYLGGNFGEGSHLTLPDNLNSFNANSFGLASTLEGNVVLGAGVLNIPYSPINLFSDSNSLGGMDACVFSMSEDLSSLQWCTVLSSSGVDYISDIEVRIDNAIVMCGGTNGSDFPFNDSAYSENTSGGYEGWAAVLSANGDELMAGTYFGSTDSEELNMIDLDEENNIWVTGVSNGIIPQSSGVYANENSSFFIAEFSEDLSNLLISTKIGGNDPEENAFQVKGFMVDKCGRVYVSGHGYLENLDSFDLTPDAFATIGGFYCAVYEPNMASLQFGTLFGGDHNDGGISQYDNKGVVYQAVCSCSFLAETLFTALPDAYDSEQSPSCEAAVYKIDFESPSVVSSFTYSPQTNCLPYNMLFNNWSDSATYQWNFGDGSGWQSIQDSSFSFSFTQSGDNLVQLVAYDINSCNVWDTMKTVIHIPDAVSMMQTSWTYGEADLCQNVANIPFAYTGTGQSTYTWILPDGSMEQDVPSLLAVINSTGIYDVQLVATDSICNFTDTLSVEFNIGPPISAAIEIEQDSNGCVPQELIANSISENADSLNWLVNGSSQSSSNQFTYSFDTSGEYDITLIAMGSIGCDLDDTTSFIVTIDDLPFVSFSLLDTICKNDGVFDLTTGSPAGGTYSGAGVSGNTFDPTVAGLGTHDITYSYTDANGCANSATGMVIVDNCTGVEEIGLQNSLHVFPNPAADAITFESNHAIRSLRIWNAAGELVEDVLPTKSQKSISVETAKWANGVYFFEAQFADSEFASGKFEVEK